MKAQWRIILRQARKIRRLKLENDRLRRLKDRGAAAQGDRYADALARAGDTAHAMSQSGYARYLYSAIRESSAYGIWYRGLTYFRRFRLLSTVIRVASWVVTLIQSGAVILLSTVLLVFMLPALILSSAVTAIVALTQGLRLNRLFKSVLQGKTVYLFFPTDHNSPVTSATIRQLSESESNFIFAVSPYAISPRLLGKKHKFFFTALNCGENVYYIRKYYYFMLWNRVLPHTSAKIRRVF